ncbi:MAG TPA: hypothetical protein VLX92_33150 [Kofleriaceae bacterium]|nr:hypothetical protein [Kofleriaceae bacterium]
MRAVAIVACIALLAGCFGYNSSAKKWSYVGDAVLIVGGGAAIGADQATKPGKCTGTDCPYAPPISGGLVIGAVLVVAGVVGILINATRADVKTSR